MKRSRRAPSGSENKAILSSRNVQKENARHDQKESSENELRARVVKLTSELSQARAMHEDSRRISDAAQATRLQDLQQQLDQRPKCASASDYRVTSSLQRKLLNKDSLIVDLRQKLVDSEHELSQMWGAARSEIAALQHRLDELRPEKVK